MARWSIFIAWVAGVWILSSIPGDEMPESPFRMSDKAAHFGLFLVGAVSLGWGLHGTAPARPLATALVVFVAIGLFGVIDELHQLWTPGRSGADVFDAMADGAGALAGAVVTLALYGRRSRKGGRSGGVAALANRAP